MHRSRYNKWWYGDVLNDLKNLDHIKNDNTMQATIFLTAVKNAEKETLLLPNGEDRLKAVNMIYYKKTHSVHGAARALYVSYSTVKRWLSAFVVAVGYNAGY